MSFWTTSSGNEATGEVNENNFDPLKKGWYTSIIEEMAIDEYQGQRKIKIKVRVVGEGYGKDRVLFLNLKTFNDEGVKESQRDRAINLLMKMAKIIGIKLPSSEPDDAWLSRFIDKPLDIMVDVWEIDGKTGNWFVNVEAKGEKSGEKKSSSSVDADIDKDIPF